MGFRVIKTAIATLLSILTADTLGVDNPLSAGLLAILGVDVTRKRSLYTVSSRFFASVLGLILAFGLFYLFGFHFWVLALYIMIAFPLIARANFKEGIVTSSVVVFRVFSGEDLSLDTMLTQIELLVIGLGYATIVNFAYMPKHEHRLSDIRGKVDELFSAIFKQIAVSLRDPYHVWNGKELIEAGTLITQGQTTANHALENQVINPNDAWNVYFYMRKQQLERVEYMLELISGVYQRMPQGEVTATLFDQLSIDVIDTSYTGKTEKLLEMMHEEFKMMELPSTREEFEIRSAILQVCRELGIFLNIAKKYKAPKQSESNQGT